MKLHLPFSLRKALLTATALSITIAGTVQAAIMHPSVSLQTYTDFGSNMGRYTIYQQNELLQHLNKGGIYITYLHGQDDYKLAHDMISYESMVDGGPFTAIGYNATATVQHNGVTNPVFTGRFIGSENAIHYAGIEYRSCENNTFLLTPQIDYKVTRISKVITDITPSALYDARAHKLAGEDINEMLQYRAGGGYMQQADETGKTTWLAGAYAYVVGGIVDNWSFGYSSGYDYETGIPAIRDGRGMPDDSYTLSIKGVIDFTRDTAGTASHPLPFVTQGGDSGSPVWVWDTFSESYQLISCHQARGSYDSYSRGASEWTKETLKSFCVDVDMDAAEHVVHIGQVQRTEQSELIEALANGSTHASTTTMYGSVRSDNNQVNKDFIGIEHGKNTWLNLYDLKDGLKQDSKGNNVNWYAYGNEYLNATNTEAEGLQYADLFMTQNLVFTSSGEETNRIVLDADVDLGIGYAQFSSKGGSASYTIESAGGNSFQFNHAGYIIDKDVDVHLQIANTQKDTNGTDYYREWRKTGEGNLYLEGTGNNNIFLNVGGKGTTFLQEHGGYAAYNVLINNGATVNILGDISQIKRDVTFGYGGGYLDFHGAQSMDWYKTAAGDPTREGFTISALTQDAIITNTTGSTTLTYKEEGDTKFLGSFQDGDGRGTLKVVYDGGKGSTWTLNSIHTKLHEESGLQVKTGTVVLVGTNTEHAQGSLTGYNQLRYSNEDDWHYADAQMDVQVDSGATFELGSHARLTGDITVQNGGTFLMREGVRHEMEYIEGWYKLESTYGIAEYYGLHGDVILNEGGIMRVEFSEKTDANTTLTGAISGAGSMTVDTAGGSLTLSGTNTFEGTKTISNGILILDHLNAAGNYETNKWNIGKSAWMTVNGTSAADALKTVDTSSEGVLALSLDEEDAPLILQGYNSLIIGAKKGEVIQFGKKEGEDREYAAVDGKWNLGGGGGELVVNYALNGGDLILGNAYTEGKVTLTNTQNKIANILFGGKVTLDYDSIAALGKASVHLEYTNRIVGQDTDEDKTINFIDGTSSGVMLLDKMGDVSNIDLTKHGELYLGVSEDTIYSGDFTLADSGSYRFGGSTATLTLTKALTDQGEEGGTNLYIDAEGYTGGVVELQQALNITGVVFVMGREFFCEDIACGEITLKVDAENAFDKVLGLYLTSGGRLDMNGHSQTLNSYMIEAGSSIIDSSDDKKGVLTLKGDKESIDSFGGSLDVGNLVIDTEGSLYMGGDSTYHNLTIEQGQIFVTSEKGLSATSQTVLKEKALLTISSDIEIPITVTPNLELQNSTVNLGDTYWEQKSNLGGTLTVKDGTTGTVNFAVNGSTLSAVVNTGETGTLKLTGNRGIVSSPLVNVDGSEEDVAGGQVSGGTVDVELNELRLQSGSSIAIGGTLNLVGQENQASHKNQLILSSGGGANNMERDISHMHVEDGLALTIQEESWNTIWNIHKLTGKGDITWNSTTTHWYSARLILDGENDFTGTLTAARNRKETTERKYAAYLELAHDKAAQFMDISIKKGQMDEYMSLAINTENAIVASLAGDDPNSALYAGVAVEGAGNNKASIEIFKNAPTSTRKACLTVNTSGEADFAGCVYGAAQGDIENGFGLDLVMAGKGTQKFSGSTIQFNNVTVQSGTLVLSTTGLDIADRTTIYRGATLDTTDNSAFELKEDTKLMVTGNASGQAILNTSLKLGGGTLGFDGTTLSDTTYALAVQGLETGDETSLNVLFESTYALHEGEYLLASGGAWTNIADNAYSAIGLDYYNAAFKADDSGLAVTLKLKDNSTIWKGTNTHSTWSDSSFGPDKTLPGENYSVVFNNMAESKTVQVEGAQKAGKLLFDSTEEYKVKAEGEASLQAESLRQTGSGTTTLGNGVNITGEAEINAGTLVLDTGAGLGSASVAEGAELKLAAVPSSTPKSITGDGRLVVDWNEETGSLGSTDIGQIEIQSGTLKVDSQPLGVRDSILVAKEGTLHATSTNFLDEESKDLPIQLAGTLQLEIGTAQDFTYAVTSTVDAQGIEQKGIIEKTGAERLTIKSSISADSVKVSEGALTVSDDAIVPDFLEKVGSLEVSSGASASVGKSNFTVGVDEFDTNFSVDGKGSNLELSLSQNGTKTITGDISVTNGGKLTKYDGGLILAGTSKLGDSALDEVTLFVSWGKKGWNFTGKVEGSGKVNLSSQGWGGVTDTCILSNNQNTFDGEFAVHAKMRLVAAAEYALRNADVTLDNDGGLLVATDNAYIRNLSGSKGSIVGLGEGLESATLTVNQNKDGDYAGSIGSGLSLTKTGDAKLSLSGDNSDFSGTLTLQQGTLSLNAARFGTSSGGFNMTLSGGTLNIEGDSLNLGTGNLAITQSTTLEVDDLARFAYSSYRDGDYDAVNGYASGNLVLVSADSITKDASASLTGSGALAGKTLLVEEGRNIVVQNTAPATKDYYVNTSVSYGEGVANTAYGQAESIVLRSSGATLELNSDLNQGVCSGGIVARAEGATVNIGQHATLHADSLHDDNTVYLDGEGTYCVQVKTNTQNIDTELGNNGQVRLAEGWTGTVKLQGAGGEKSHLMLENYGRTGSNIMLTGHSGWLSNGAKIAANLLLEPASGTDALTISNGSSNGVEYFQGAISGSGSINRTWSGGKLAFHFSGDVSEWTGSIKTSNGSLALYFYGDATDMGAAISTEPGKTTDIYVGEKASAPADATFRQAVTATSLNLLGASSAKLNATTSLATVSGTNGTLSVLADTNVTDSVALAGLKLGANGELKVGSGQSASGLTISAQNGEGSINAAISLDTADNNHSITGADGSRIENTLIDLAAGTRLEMANVTLGASSCITDDNAVLVANGLTVEADILSNLKPLTYGDAAPAPVEEPADMVSLTLSNIQDVVIDGEGTGLVVRMVGNSSQALSGAEWMRLGLGEGDLTGQFADSLAVTLLYQDATGLQRSAQGVYTWEDVEVQAAAEAAALNHDYVYFRLTGTVPEPATSTLSLLALAALAARRRRK